jgi:hypothetical protein
MPKSLLAFFLPVLLVGCQTTSPSTSNPKAALKELAQFAGKQSATIKSTAAMTTIDVPGRKLIPDGSSLNSTSTITEQVNVAADSKLNVRRRTSLQTVLTWIGGTSDTINRGPQHVISNTITDFPMGISDVTSIKVVSRSQQLSRVSRIEGEKVYVRDLGRGMKLATEIQKDIWIVSVNTNNPVRFVVVEDGKRSESTLREFDFLHFDNRDDADRAARLLSQASGVPVTH